MLTTRVKGILKWSLTAGIVVLLIQVATATGIGAAFLAGVNTAVGCVLGYVALQRLKLHWLFPRLITALADRSPINGKKLGTYEVIFHDDYGCTLANMFFTIAAENLTDTKDKKIGHYVLLLISGIFIALALASLLYPWVVVNETLLVVIGMLTPFIIAKLVAPLYIARKGEAQPVAEVEKPEVKESDIRYVEEKRDKKLQEAFFTSRQHAQTIRAYQGGGLVKTIAEVEYRRPEEGCFRCRVRWSVVSAAYGRDVAGPVVEEVPDEAVAVDVDAGNARNTSIVAP